MKSRILSSVLKHLPVITALALLSSTAAYATQYTVTDLGTLGGTNSFAYAINSTGQVVGQADNSAGTGEPFLYSNGSMQDLGTLGGTNGYAHSINSTGQVVGSATNSLGDYNAFLYSNGSMQNLGTFGGCIVRPTA